MSLIPCFECGKDSNEQHHVIPKSLGGTKTVSLCHECHGKVHGIKRTNLSLLTKLGLMKARLAGKKIGGHNAHNKAIVDLILKLSQKSIHQSEIAKRLDLPRETVRGIIRRNIAKS